MICHVEEFYIFLSAERINLAEKDEIRKFVNDNGFECLFDDDEEPLSVTVETFFDCDEANDFKHELLARFRV